MQLHTYRHKNNLCGVVLICSAVLDQLGVDNAGVTLECMVKVVLGVWEYVLGLAAGWSCISHELRKGL